MEVEDLFELVEEDFDDVGMKRLETKRLLRFGGFLFVVTSTNCMNIRCLTVRIIASCRYLASLRHADL